MQHWSYELSGMRTIFLQSPMDFKSNHLEIGVYPQQSVKQNPYFPADTDNVKFYRKMPLRVVNLSDFKTLILQNPANQQTIHIPETLQPAMANVFSQNPLWVHTACREAQIRNISIIACSSCEYTIRKDCPLIIRWCGRK